MGINNEIQRIFYIFEIPPLNIKQMKKLIAFLIISLNVVAQNNGGKKDIHFRYLAVEKNTKDTLIGAFTEVFSGNKRIKAKCCTYFYGE